MNVPSPPRPPVAEEPAARLIAFHLPQFYPTPENDEWWGKGFTEWTNVVKARPLFRGHRQPRLPADLGFYDLRLPEARAAQAELAREYGIHGFCYWHYWFQGRRILDRPVDAILASGEPDFPFCLAWANHRWSRTWTGDKNQVLIEQEYSAEDDEAHARWLARAFADPRYIRVGDRPMFLVYNPLDLPEPRRFTDAIRRECVRQGLADPYLVGMITTFNTYRDTRELGFDASEFHSPQMGVFPGNSLDRPLLWRLRHNLRRHRVLSLRLKIFHFRFYESLMARFLPKFPYHPCCFVGWDNTARRDRLAFVVQGPTPGQFRDSLVEAMQRVATFAPQERIVFINAWNEWAEGMYLEPDNWTGRRYLEAVAEARELAMAAATS